MIENANLYGRLNLYAWRDRLTQYPLEAVRTVGLKTLKNKLSEYVRLAASGETVVITVVDVAGDNQCIRSQLHDLAVEPREERLVLNVPVESVELVSQMRVSWNPADRRLLLSTCPENQPSEKAQGWGTTRGWESATRSRTRPLRPKASRPAWSCTRIARSAYTG